jgi:hypothetical protein
MILVPASVAVIVGIVVAGGPAEALAVVDHLLRDAARLALQTINGLL